MMLTKDASRRDLSQSDKEGSASQAIGRRAAMGLLCAMAVLGGCSMLFPATYRYRMTVEVDTPQGLRSGSSVIEVQTSGGSGTPDTSLHTRVRGEAVAVDLPNGATLFALLRTPDDLDGGAGFAPTAYQPVLPDLRKSDTGDWSDLLRVLKRQREPAALPVSYYPMLVRFLDNGDPKSVRLVDPDSLAMSFGESFRLRRVTIQITDDPITTGINKRFHWWEKYLQLHFDDTSTVAEDLTTEDPKAHLSSGSFSTESH